MCCPRIAPPLQLVLGRVDGVYDRQNGWRYLMELAEDGSLADAVIRAAPVKENDGARSSSSTAVRGRAARLSLHSHVCKANW